MSQHLSRESKADVIPRPGTAKQHVGYDFVSVVDGARMR